jgi:CheY-like chemotaxis protein
MRALKPDWRNAMWNGKPINEKLVLVVDDDRSVRESLSGLLDLKGYSVLEAENGQTALDVLEKAAHFPCLILLDLAMPIMDGHGFLKLRAKHPMLRQIPVVVVSGNPPDGEPLNGINAYLQKPVRFDRLIAIVNLAASS